MAGNSEVVRVCDRHDERDFESQSLLKGWIATSRQIILLVGRGIEIEHLYRRGV